MSQVWLRLHKRIKYAFGSEATGCWCQSAEAATTWDTFTSLILLIRGICEIRGQLVWLNSGGPDTTRFHSSVAALKFVQDGNRGSDNLMG